MERVGFNVPKRKYNPDFCWGLKLKSKPQPDGPSSESASNVNGVPKLNGSFSVRPELLSSALENRSVFALPAGERRQDL